MTTPDYRDLVITEFAANEVDLLERIASLEAQVLVWSEMTHETLHLLYGTQSELRQLRRRHYLLIADYRLLRAATGEAA